MSRVVLRFMTRISFDAWHEPFDRGLVGRLGSIPEGVACMNVRKVFVPVVGAQRRMISSRVGHKSLIYP